jgi:hypothetical protein
VQHDGALDGEAVDDDRAPDDDRPAGAERSRAERSRGEEVVTRELGFAVGLLRRSAFRRELQQVCVELGLGCEIDERRRLLTTRLRVLVRGTREGVDALVDYARISGWSTWTDDALGGSLG